MNPFLVDNHPESTLEISRNQLLCMAQLVENAFDKALHAFQKFDVLSMYEIIENDKAINSFEIDIDNSTYNILTIYKLPEYILRNVLSIQKVNATLERIGDHIVNIAESLGTLLTVKSNNDMIELNEMFSNCKVMLSIAIHTFFEKNTQLSKQVLENDDKIDNYNLFITDCVKKKVLQNEMSFETAMEIIRVSKNLERIADLSCNIAEETEFVVNGKNIKHSFSAVEKELMKI